MPQMSLETLEKIYAGWLAKIIGIRLGAAIEGWTHEQIKNVYGALEDYPVDFQLFAADDDSNGPFFFARALEDCGKNGGLDAEDVAEALLNYAPCEHGFFWWGGYGISTEHTAYLNLKAGIPAPRSGSIEQNGRTMAEQIGGQIFIDCWGLAAPGQPALAARYAQQAAGVTHGGEGIYGGVFVAACISQAFVENDIELIIEAGLAFIPEDCTYAGVVREVAAFHKNSPDDWEACYQYVAAHHGYDKYPGNCHIIPNSAVMALALLYGEGDFSNTLNICNRCGWDTDCNVGNVATIMGVRGGLAAIDERWRRPINDFLACSSVVGSLNAQDIPFGALYFARLAALATGQALPPPYADLAENRPDCCHFEFPGSTHALQMRLDMRGDGFNQQPELFMQNTAEAAHTGARCLKVVAKPLRAGQRLCVFKQTYYRPEDFHDSRYDPAFSPLLYPGQTVHGSACLPKDAPPCAVRLYARNARTGEDYLGEAVKLEPQRWAELSFTLPALPGVLLREAGFAFTPLAGPAEPGVLVAYVDDFYFDGAADYSVEFAHETEEYWTNLHIEISQFTKLKGNLFLQDGALHLAGGDCGEAYTGHHAWGDYAVTYALTPHTGEEHYACLRVQGGVRSYMAGFAPGGRMVLLKNTRRGFITLAEAPFAWQAGRTYSLELSAQGDTLHAAVDGTRLTAVDEDAPYLTGGVGLAVRGGSHLSCAFIRVRPL